MESCAINRLFARSAFTENVQTTAQSFKSWDTCMNNKACKIIAIVGIALASVVALWLVGAILTCFRQGVTGVGSFFCWCCNCGKRNSRAPANEGYGRAGMVAPPAAVVYQPIQQPQSAYYRNRDDYFDERKKSNDVFELEEDFDLEKQREKSKKKRLPAVTHDVDEDNSVYQPSNTITPTNPWHSFNPGNTANSHQSPYPPEDSQPYQGYNYYHQGFNR